MRGLIKISYKISQGTKWKNKNEGDRMKENKGLFIHGCHTYTPGAQ